MLPEFPPLYKLSLHPHTKPVTTVLWKYTNRTCGVFVVAQQNLTWHLQQHGINHGGMFRLLGVGLLCPSFSWSTHMPAVGHNVSLTCYGSAHVMPCHQDTSYSPHGPCAPALNLHGVVFEWPVGKKGVPSRGSNAGLRESVTSSAQRCRVRCWYSSGELITDRHKY